MSASNSGSRVPDSELEYDDDLTYRWHGRLFTGIGFDEAEDGSRSAVSYRHGVQEGPARDWYTSGVLKGESWFRGNVKHGAEREYDQSGNLLRDASFEYGILTSNAERDRAGNMIMTFRIDPNSKSYALLERYRQEKGWAA